MDRTCAHDSADLAGREAAIAWVIKRADGPPIVKARQQQGLRGAVQGVHSGSN